QPWGEPPLQVRPRYCECPARSRLAVALLARAPRDLAIGGGHDVAPDRLLEQPALLLEDYPAGAGGDGQAVLEQGAEPARDLDRAAPVLPDLVEPEVHVRLPVRPRRDQP